MTTITHRAPIIVLDKVSLTYGTAAASVHAVKDVSFEIMPGEMLLLMGPSGSGKTSILQLIGGLLKPASGHVLIDGRPTTHLDQNALSRIRLNRIGFVFQNYQLFRSLRAWENVALAFELLGTKPADIEALSRELLDVMGISDRADAYPSELSGGQKQRVAIARALASDPDLLLADEPTAALDSRSGERIGELLKEVAHELGRAVVAVTHDRRLTRIADRVISLEDGRIVGIEAGEAVRQPTMSHTGRA